MTAAHLGGPGFSGARAAETVALTAESLLAFENAALPLAVCNPGGRIVICNRALRTLLGYELDELLGMPIAEVVEVAPDALYKTWDDRLDAGALDITPERPYTLWRKDGSAVNVRASSSLVHDNEGNVRYVIARAVVDPNR
ncbi:MAG: PAS domain-containing protein [Acidimicrobiia bacterium]|nr:PAS domain-containing protein [Acidimicrobiia bacterium]MBV8983156.1 PAS domain-containing protein [Acidimicrobiia bacterium]